ASSTTLPDNSTTAAYFAKYSPTGALVWARGLASSSSNNNGGNGIAVDASGNGYVIGVFTHTASYRTSFGADTSTGLVSAGFDDIFILKIDANGALIWARGVGGGSVDIAADVAVDDAGTVYVTGTYQGTVDFDRTASTLGDTLTSPAGATGTAF